MMQPLLVPSMVMRDTDNGKPLDIFCPESMISNRFILKKVENDNEVSKPPPLHNINLFVKLIPLDKLFAT